jgi:hypothetical protein
MLIVELANHISYNNVWWLWEYLPCAGIVPYLVQ